MPNRKSSEAYSTPIGLAQSSAGPFWLPGNPRLRRATLAIMDAVLLAAGLGMNFEIWLRYRHGRMPEEYGALFLWVVVPVVLVRIGMFAAFGLYRAISRHTGTHEIVLIASANAVATALIIVGNFILAEIPSLGSFPPDFREKHLLRIPWGVVFSDWMMAMITVGGVRLVRREIARRLFSSFAGEAKRAIIVGAGDAGEQVARDLAQATRGAYVAVAFVDPNPAMKGNRIHGLPVEGGIADLPAAIARHRADEIVIALARPAPRVLSEIVEHCRNARLEFRIIPDLTSVMTGGMSVSTLRPVEIEDLLGREPVNLDQSGEKAYLRGKCVLITGAGGSIGRELCRQALAQSPARIVLLGKGENSIFEAIAELEPSAKAAGVELQAVVGDVRDESLVRSVFARFKPNVVFHAAAHKHVHLMEAQPSEAVKNNILGTLCVARVARESGVERFILISTDKAVRPTGIMGASKRVAEMITGAMARGAQGAFLAVRFGNVLGSRGSVIPTFRKQIERGGPVTITHPDVERYFMTIPEAVSLVIEAGRIGKGGELFLLDMGKPVRIADLARNLITLSGLEPETDIPIVFTGLRPGEKLKEELMTETEGLTATEHGKIFIARGDAPEWSALEPRVARFAELAAALDEEGIRAMLKELIPEYKTVQ